MRAISRAYLVGLCFVLGCQAPDLLLSSRQQATAKCDDYGRLWQAARAVIARQFDVLQENEREGRIVAQSKSVGTTARPNADPYDSRTVTTDVNVFILPKSGGYEAQVRASTRAQTGPDFNVVRTTGLPQTREGMDFNELGTSASRDYALEEQIRSQIQNELNYAPPPPRPTK
jgi:hypothetical protein